MKTYRHNNQLYLRDALRAGVFLFVTSVLYSFGAYAFASTVYLESESNVFLPNSQVAVDLKLDTEGVEVNAIKVSVAFPDEHLQFIEAYERDSMITAWVDRPKVSGNTVILSGIMAGGYVATINPLIDDAHDGTIVRMIFETYGEGSGTLSFPDVELYKNDGLGGIADVKVENYDFTISSTKGTSQGLEIDIYPPESFTPIIGNNEYIFDGKYFLAFHTQDKQTGVAYYEVKEGRRSWERVESPYLLHDQSLRSVIWVKAVDYAGNVRKEQLHGTALVPIIVIVTSIIIFGTLLLFTIRRIRHAVQ